MEHSRWTLLVASMVATLCLIPCLVTSARPEIPEHLDRPINETLTYINQLIGETQTIIKDHRFVAIPTLETMNRGLVQGGPIEELITVGRYVYHSYLNEIHRRTDQLIERTNQQLLAAVTHVSDLLLEVIEPAECDPVVKSAESKIHSIDRELSQMRRSIESKYWKLFDEVSDLLRKLHATKWPSNSEYRDRMEEILAYGAETIDRFIYEVGSREEHFLHQVINEVRWLVGKALRAGGGRSQSDKGQDN